MPMTLIRFITYISCFLVPQVIGIGLAPHISFAFKGAIMNRATDFYSAVDLAAIHFAICGLRNIIGGSIFSFILIRR